MALFSRLLPTWSANRARWVGRAPNSVTFELPATNRRVQAWMKQVEPVLVVRCLANRTEAFVYTETAARIEPQADKTADDRALARLGRP